MSIPNQQIASPVAANEQHDDGGSSSKIGPVIGVLAVIVVLGVISVMIGRLCAGRRIPGLGQYDFEGWFERKFAPCIDGRDGTPHPRRASRHTNGDTTDGGGGGAVPVAIPAEMPQEMKQTDAATVGHES